MDPEDRVTASGACLQVDARGSSTALAQPNTAKVEELLMHACDVGAAVVAMEEWIANKQTKTRTVVFALLVINKAGGLIYNRNFAPGLQKLNSNDYLILAGTFHGIHAISRSLSPVAPPPAPPGSRPNPATGIQSLESSHFRLTCFQTPTGTKFLLFTSPEQPNTNQIARRCYDIYADYVMANPFYNLEMPIRVDKFDRALAAYLVRP